jgi:hypothetical protein
MLQRLISTAAPDLAFSSPSLGRGSHYLPGNSHSPSPGKRALSSKEGINGRDFAAPLFSILLHKWGRDADCCCPIYSRKELKMSFAERQLDKAIKNIENDPNMTDAEKNKAIREEEMGLGDYIRQYEDEREALDRKYGF